MKIGDASYKQFADERLRPFSTQVDPRAYQENHVEDMQIYRSNVKKMKLNDTTKELRGNCNLFARCALIQGKRSIDMKAIIGNYELTVFPKSLFSSYGSLLDGSKSKSDAVTEILKAAKIEQSDQLPTRPDCVVFDAMRVLNKMSTKRFKTGKDLSNKFLDQIDAISLNAGLQIIEFDTYSETPSLN